MTVRTLVTGGARSGKSAFAERLAQHLGGEDVLYVATAEAPEDDEEMQRRVKEHRLRRPAGWSVYEVSYSAPVSDLSGVMEAAGAAEAVLLDSLSLWVSGRMSSGADEELLHELDHFLSQAAEIHATFVLVTDEVGLGLVPESPEGRRFRDLLGLANQRVAAAADEVYLCVAGVPLKVR